MNEIFVKPAVGAIITKQTDNNEFILVQDRKKNSADGTDGLLEIPAGKIRDYENIFDALRREVWEETGLKVEKATYQFSLPNIYIYSGFPVHTLDMFFLCTVKDMSHFSAMDDVADSFFLPLSDIHPEDFGLDSIRRGLVQFLAQHS